MLAIDHGERRVGLAISDPDFDFVRGLPTLDRRALSGSLVDAIVAVVEREGVERVVLGIPFSMDGEEGPAAEAVRVFQGRLAAALDVPIDTWDERLTSEAAKRALREAGHSEREMKGKIDQLAAVLMLEGYLRRWRTREDT